MSAENTSKIPSNVEVIEELTKELGDQVSIKEGNLIQEGGTDEKIPVNNFKIPKDFEEPLDEEKEENLLDDNIDEVAIKDQELELTEDEKEERHKKAIELKNKGNEEFRNEHYDVSIRLYTEGLQLCPLKYENDRAVLFANRAASKSKLSIPKQSAIDDCTKALELNDKYVKAYLRRAKLYEDIDKLDECLEDYKKILELDPGNKEAIFAQQRLPSLINERNEKLKTEMLGKLKDLGNMVLRPFGLSTENFQLQQDPNSGGYSVNFKQTPR